MNTLEEFLSVYDTVAREMTVQDRKYTFRVTMTEYDENALEFARVFLCRMVPWERDLKRQSI